MVALVALYELAKVGFFGYVFVQCLQAQGSGLPPYGDVDAHNPLFESPVFFVFAVLAVYHLALVLGLFTLRNWARAGSTFVLVCAGLWWILQNVAGYKALAIPVDSPTLVSALALEVVAVATLYVTPQARDAFAPTEQRAP